ncbi:hypothetical protein PHO31112_05016 [Pandoraea horticolens]|uniref:Lipoprotein n=1 Tax=Pandoraea horticolens TaxID=2508298 RepID=A0A5E4Z520_9BURK|nr:hypothetical protein [Pandoraea horticolens]VVE55645.1 hypothetical protein PHO31112_05016 [Pandoraea horticolens]
MVSNGKQRVYPVALAVVLTLSNAAGANELRVEWLNSPCPKGLPAQDAEEGAQKFAPIVGAVITVLAPKLIAAGIDLAAKKLQAAGSDRPDLLSARTDAFFYEYLRQRRNALQARCIVAVEAENFNAPLTEEEPHRWRINAPHVGGFINPRMIFMAAVEPAPEGKLFRLVPTYLEIGDWRVHSFFGGSKRDYNFTVSLTAIGAAKPFASTDLAFKGLSDHTVYVASDPVLSAQVSDFMPLPEVSTGGAKYVSDVETAWASKDRAASLLDAQYKISNEKKKRAEPGYEAPPGKEPSVYNDGRYTAKLDAYCKGVAQSNKPLASAQRTVPAECNWRNQVALEAATSTKADAELRPTSLVWAAKTCWPDPTVRKQQLAMPAPKGYICTEPSTLAEAPSKLHTRVATLVVVSEVIPGSKAAKFFGDVLADSKADVSKVITDQLPPMTDQAKDAKDSAQRALQQAVVDADFQVTLAQNRLDELPADSPASKFTELRMKRQAAWYAANNAYRAVGRPPPYPETDQ